ncbi:Dabb family protein [Cesiribacter sp. SM1]|uniref:Dabb family protein n=1 Tax=Cesiribacter sp. SM1 TaxID=2861196 RepID=UPI001CD46FBA|nr:Dabb family protein [Cesiribacter sp. SM1]
MFVHHVFFWLKNPDSSEDRNQLEEGLLELEKIDVIRTFHVGVPASTNRPVIERGYAFSLLLIFDDLEDQETYQTHPVHERFVKECSHLWAKVVVYDSVD